jgi:Calx-beta domain/RTX calcium-binding nonapeptide repeat (4 copies)
MSATLSIAFLGASTAIEGGPGTAGAVTVRVTAAGAFVLGEVAGATLTAVDASATNNSDYFFSEVAVSFTAPGTQDFIIPYNPDLFDEFDENFSLRLTTPTNNTVGQTTSFGNSSALATIVDDDAPLLIRQISFSPATYVVVEGQTFIELTINRSGDGLGSVLASIATVDGTAAAGDDYTPLSQDSTTFFFPDGDLTSKTVRIPILDDTSPNEIDETFSVDLIENRGGSPVVVDTATVTIQDNDSNSGFGTLSLTPTATNVNENAGFATVNLTYTGGNIPTTISYTVTTANGTGSGAAIAGQDYIASEFTLENIPGTDAFTVPLTIPIINDTDAEITETFNVNVTESEGALLGVSTVVVNILDDDSGEGVTVGPGTNPTFGPEAPFFPVSVDGNNEIFGSAGNDTLFGGKGNDSVTGLGGNDTVYGGQDQDSLFGNLGNDFLYANKGNDTIFGGQGDDILYGGQGDDTIFGNDGNDFLAGDIGVDVLAGAGGSDRFAIQAAKGTDFVADFIVGEDLLSLTGGLQFGDVSILQSGGDTRIRLNSSGDDLLVLVGVQSFLVTAASFITE